MKSRELFHIFYLLGIGVVFSSCFAIFLNNSLTIYELVWMGVFYIALTYIAGGHHFYNKAHRTLALTTLSVQVVVFVAIFILSLFKVMQGFHRFPTLLACSIAFISTHLFNYAALSVYRKLFAGKRLCVIGDEDEALKSVKNLMKFDKTLFTITHVITKDFTDNIKEHLSEFDAIYFSGQVGCQRDELYSMLIDSNKEIYNAVYFVSTMEIDPSIYQFGDDILLGFQPFKLSALEQFAKRMVDIIVSGLLLVISSPIMLLVALAIKLDSKGPVFYTQERVTMNGKLFNVLKFRSMVNNAEEASGPVLATSNDSRVTKLGQILRATRLDELPQFINILKGDMSIVGPRPERPHFVKQFEEKNPHYHLRHRVRAGLTGYAQVYGTYNSDFNRKLKYDLLYIQKQSFLFDIKLIFRTLSILLDKFSAQGVDEEKLGEITLESLQLRNVVVK